MLIEEYVKTELLWKTGFYYSPNFYDQSNPEKDIFCYLGHLNGKSIVVVREHIKKEENKIWYFNSFEGEPIRLLFKYYPERFLGKIRETCTEEHKIDPKKDLEKAILRSSKTSLGKIKINQRRRRSDAEFGV